MTTTHTFIPERSFADKLEGLVKFLMEQGFTFSLIDINQCLQDAIKQREERTFHDALAAKYREVHARFAVDQRERYRRYVRLLNAARAAYRDDKAMLAAISRFAHEKPRRSSKTDTPQAGQGPQPEQPLQASALTPALPKTPSA